MLRNLWRVVWSRWRERPPCSTPDVVATAADDRATMLDAGVAAALRGDHDAALAFLERYTALHPEVADGWNALGNVTKLRGDLAGAALHYRKALDLEPGAAGVWSNLGRCLRSEGRTTEALAALERALELDPGNPDAVVTRAGALSDCARYEEAEAGLKSLLAEHPVHAQAHAMLAHVLLLKGRFAEGWDEFEWRWRLPDAEPRAPLAIAEWDGTPAPDALLLICAEQGLGDQIMLASCIPDASARVGECWLECDPRLVPLFARSFPAVRVFPRVAAGPPAWAAAGRTPDFQIVFGSLPLLLRRRLEDFPPPRAYLRADTVRVARWRARLAGLGTGPCIGISWRGGGPTTRGRLRSIPLQQWVPILDRDNAIFVNLQYGPCEQELSALHTSLGGTKVHEFPEAISDYEETVALVAALDGVISVQTAVAELAGALGCPTWILLSASPGYRYLASGDSMVWYPSVRLFRQQRLGDWCPVIDAVARRLDAGFGDA